MAENTEKESANLELKRFYDTATNNIQTSALVNRALADKISTETINQKVNNQLQSIYVSMNRINPRFNETSKNYGVIKKDILDVLTDYEIALTELSDYYDLKLEELILKKVELETHFVGKVFRDESIKQNEDKEMRFKDYLKSRLSEKSENMLNKVSSKKQEKSSVDFKDIRALQDLEDLKVEQDNRSGRKISNMLESEKTNQVEIGEIEEEIKKIEKEISDINDKKRLQLEEAMETREKWISTTLRKPSVWARTKTFFSNRFSTAKVISKTIIAPLKMKVREFRVNELEGLKG